MTESTQAARGADNADSVRSENVTALWADVVLDDDAIQAQRLALLAELTAEHFHVAYLQEDDHCTSSERVAARQLKRAAAMARRAADQERNRCAAHLSSRSITQTFYGRDLT